MKYYLDYNATAPLLPGVHALMQELQALALNASSAHALGRRAKSIVEDARRTIAQHIGAFAHEVAFVASGTEANNWVLRAFAHQPVFVSAIEHSSVLKTARSFGHHRILPVDADGVVTRDALASLLPQNGPFLCSVMLANNETGVLQPVRAVADLVHARGGLMHCDAVQALGKIPVDFTALGCDFMTLCCHKMGGPVGTAALVIKNNIALPAMLTGGGQELNRRAGTENVAAIAGFAKAVELMDYERMRTLGQWMAGFERECEAQGMGAIVAGKAAMRLPNTCCILMPNVPAETQLIRFDLEGIAVSAGSACSSGRIEPSHVLKAMGFSESQANCALRVSGGWNTAESDLATLLLAWKALFRLKNAGLP